MLQNILHGVEQAPEAHAKPKLSRVSLRIEPTLLQSLSSYITFLQITMLWPECHILSVVDAYSQKANSHADTNVQLEKA